GIRTLVTAAPPPQLNVTEEPPLAQLLTPSTSENAGPPISEASLPPVTLPPDAIIISPSAPWSPPRMWTLPLRPSIPLPTRAIGN
ncbi:MAG TPA: hypothetical protein VKE74_27905, partial [Gemmataceae bacterium]|nr:hypothetical protein [Gemmataceae bacterium]